MSGPWSNQSISLIVLTEQTTGFSGIFGYSPTVGSGNLIFSLSAAAGTDPYGNAYPQGLNLGAGTISGLTISGSTIESSTIDSSTINAGNTVINSSGVFTYSSTPAAGNLVASQAPSSGTDGFGNNYLAGVSSYSGVAATSLDAGFIQFLTGSLSGGWFQQGTLETDGSGDLLSTFGGSLILENDLSCVTINGSDATGDGSNGGVTGFPSTSTNAFPAAGPGHTHPETHTHPI